MFWILRRTGAANFFNSFNSNCNSSKGNNNNRQDKYVKRPPRKSYGRLSADSDDAASIKHKIDDPFDDLDNFEMITSGSSTANGNNSASGIDCAHAGCFESGDSAEDGIRDIAKCPVADCQGNYVNSGLCDLNFCVTNVNTGVYKTNAAKEVNVNTINRLHEMAMSDDDDYDESLTCNVCDRAFHYHRQLASHQQKKRHFGCGGCDSLFPSLMLLEHHKEEFEHWSDDEMSRRICCRGDEYFTDTDSSRSEAESEDLERLL